MSYAQFHLVFLLPALLCASLFARPALRHLGRSAVLGLAFIVFLAIGYTTPWDAYLVRESVWWYGEDRVLDTVFGVPIEEYAFFVLQSLLMGLVVLAALHRRPPSPNGTSWSPADRRRVRRLGVATWLGVCMAGAAFLQFEPSRYLGLILVWAAPVLALVWGVGGDRLWSARSTLVLPVAVVTAYLWIADRLAIGMGIWTISERFTVGWALLGLPVEEAVFFLVTNLMVTMGLTLFTLEAWRRLDYERVPLTVTPGTVDGHAR